MYDENNIILFITNHTYKLENNLKFKENINQLL